MLFRNKLGLFQIGDKMEQIKSGKEVLDEFFQNIKKIKNVDTKLAEAIITLYKSGKALTEKSLNNCLQELRKNQDEN